MTNYADDTSLLVTAALYPEMVASAGGLMESANNWFSGNKMILNNTKTNIVLFKNSRAGIESPNNIKINNSVLELTSSAKFLGLHIDDTLSWSKHVSEVCKKLEAACYAIRVLSRYLDLNSLRSVYFANFESKFRYAIVFYGASSESKRISIIQKKVLRAILHLSFRETCRGSFKANKILTFTAVYIQECCLFSFKNQHLFTRVGSQHNYSTRNMEYLFPNHSLTLTEKGTYYNCIKFFNSLPKEYKVIQDYKVFKRNIHKMLLDIEPYSISEYLANIRSN